MASKIFEHWLFMFDLQMKRQNRNVILLLDNASGHYLHDKFDKLQNVKVRRYLINLDETNNLITPNVKQAILMIG